MDEGTGGCRAGELVCWAGGRRTSCYNTSPGWTETDTLPERRLDPNKERSSDGPAQDVDPLLPVLDGLNSSKASHICCKIRKQYFRVKKYSILRRRHIRKDAMQQQRQRLATRGQTQLGRCLCPQQTLRLQRVE